MDRNLQLLLLLIGFVVIISVIISIITMLHIFLYIFIAVVFLALLFGVYYRKHSGVCTCKTKMDGKTVIITGANAGIGREAAYELASRGARVILACRNLAKAEAAKEWIVSSTGNTNVVVRHLDLADLRSVRKFSEETLQEETRIDVLINNAGSLFMSREVSKQGFELTLATNHYGHFLLTNLLLGLMMKSSPSRIINVSAAAHHWFYLDFNDIHFKKRSYSVYKSYAQSKLCNILFTKKLSHRLLLIGKDVTVNCLHPGVVATEIMLNDGSLFRYFLYYTAMLILKSPKLGAQTIIHMAVSDTVEKVTGEYYVDCKIAETSKKARDPGLAKQLWDFTEEEVELTKDEKFI